MKSRRLRRANKAFSQEKTPLEITASINPSCLRRAFDKTRKDASPGIDGQQAKRYRKRLRKNLADLAQRVQRGVYWPPPVRTIQVGKKDGKRRELSIPTFEDKLLQRAVVTLLEPVLEGEFLDCSFAFRRRRNSAQALRAFRRLAKRHRIAWVIRADIHRFFESIDHETLLRLLSKRVQDPAFERLLGSWLGAGEMKGRRLFYSRRGLPQGWVISPLLSNLYLHEALDLWFQTTLKPTLKGEAFLLRYSDDFLIGFRKRSDAQRVLQELPKRLAHFRLRLSERKTQLLPFRPRRWWPFCWLLPRPKPEKFQFLGYQHFWKWGLWRWKLRKQRVKR